MHNNPTLGISLSQISPASGQSAVVLNPATWLKHPEISQVLEGELPTEIRRSDVELLAASIDWENPEDDELELLFVNTMAWGSGKTNGRGPGNTAKALQKSEVAEVLRCTANLLQRTDIADAYYGHKRLWQVGPAFFTKLLWAIGTAIGTKPTPLILDSRVWESLGELKWDSLQVAGSRKWGDHYVAYLCASAEWARATGSQPADIEYTLFLRSGK